MAILTAVLTAGKKAYDAYKKYDDKTKSKSTPKTTGTPKSVSNAVNNEPTNTYNTNIKDYPGMANDTYQEVIRKATSGIELTNPENSQNALLYSRVRDNMTNKPYEAYNDNLQTRYAELNDNIVDQNKLAVEQGTNRLESQKANINQSAEENARNAYVMYMQNKKALPQQLATQGITGGATETANLGLMTNYQNNINNINQYKQNSIQDIDNAIIDLKNTGDLSSVEQILANNQQALNAYQQSFAQQQAYKQWAANYNLSKNEYDDNKALKERAYQDDLNQKELATQIDTIGQYYDDYQAEIDRRTAINPNDPMIPYLKLARQQKVQNIETSNQELIEKQQAEAWNRFEKLGYADSVVSSVLGIPEGSKTTDYMNTQSLISSRNKSSSGGDSSSNASTLSFSTINNTVDNMLEEYKTAGSGNMYKGNKLASDYLIENALKGNLNEDELKAIMVSKSIPVETVASAIYRASGKDIETVNGFINNYFNNKVDDSYKQKIIDYATTH